MKKRGFTLIELLIIITIIAILVGVALPYYQDYIKQAKLAKAEHELDIIKEALIKYDTMEELPFRHNDLRYLLGNYLQDLPRDPWDRDYHIDWVKGMVWSDGPDTDSIYDDIRVEYKPPLTLQKATWLDLDNNSHVSANDMIRLQFSRCLFDCATDSVIPLSISNASPAADGSDLWVTEDFDGGFIAGIVASYPASSSEILLILPAPAVDNPFYPGSSSIRVSPKNTKLRDWVDLADGSGKRRANGSNDDADPVDWIRIKGR